MAIYVDLPPELQLLIGPVLADLRSSAEVDLRFADEPWAGDRPSFMVWESDGTGSGVSIPPDLPGPEMIADVADQIQDLVLEARHSSRVRPVAWPECPVHQSHPLDARVRDGQAVWVCPKDAPVGVVIGQLAP